MTCSPQEVLYPRHSAEPHQTDLLPRWSGFLLAIAHEHLARAQATQPRSGVLPQAAAAIGCPSQNRIHVPLSILVISASIGTPISMAR